VFFNDKTKKPRTDLKNGFGTACVIAGLDDFRFHDLRHTAATRLADAGTNTREIMAILGHRCIQTSARYTHASTEEMERAMELVASYKREQSFNSEKNLGKISAKQETAANLQSAAVL
jgi:integrase